MCIGLPCLTVMPRVLAAERQGLRASVFFQQRFDAGQALPHIGDGLLKSLKALVHAIQASFDTVYALVHAIQPPVDGLYVSVKRGNNEFHAADDAPGDSDDDSGYCQPLLDFGQAGGRFATCLRNHGWGSFLPGHDTLPGV